MSVADARELLHAAAHALRVCQHSGGNSPHLAQSTADRIDAYLAAPAPSAPPREPTPAMILAASAIYNSGTEWNFGDIWRAMYDAAVAAPAAEPVAQQPEAPPADQDVAATLLRLADMNGAGTEVCRAAAARIESDAERIRASEERAKMLFDAKNDWAERARAAEADAARWRWLQAHDMRLPALALAHAAHHPLTDAEVDRYVDAAIAEEGRK